MLLTIFVKSNIMIFEELWLHLRPVLKCAINYLFYDGGPYHTETSPLICSDLFWFGFTCCGIQTRLESIVYKEFSDNSFNPLILGINKKVTHT